MNSFVTSIPAQAAARCIIETARSLHLLDQPVAVSNELAEAEKKLIVKMFQQMDEHIKSCGEELSPDEVSSLFTFVFAKAAEAVTNMFNHKEQTFDMQGMFDGRIPLYADDAVTAEFKSSQFPAMCTRNYLDFTTDKADELAGCDPLLLLFEALKWCFRLSCHLAVTIVENHNKLRQ
ncbi:MAG: hypothetical protein IKD23_00550 [Lentisphaeria bacterium]|nr:hypothetical protein [Lentisphaeria bacterium]